MNTLPFDPHLIAAESVKGASRAPAATLGVPLYNGAEFLQASLDSLVAQTFEDFEILISDNASDDGTEQICRRYADMDRRVRYVRHEINRGAAWNHNFVVTRARGRYFRWHHADDLCEPRLLEYCIAALEADSELVLAYPRTLLIDEAGRVTKHYDDRLALREETPRARLNHLLSNVVLCNPVLGVMRIEALRRTALMGSYLSSDHVLLAELAMAGRWAEVPDAFFRRRIHVRGSREANRSVRDLAAWFAPQLRGSWFFWPNLRLLIERCKAVGRARMGWQEQLHCLRTVIAWEAKSEAGRLRTRIANARNRIVPWARAPAGHSGHADKSGQRLR